MVRLKGFEPPTFWFVAVLEVQFVPIFSHFQPFRLKIKWSCDLFCQPFPRVPVVSVVVVVVMERASLDSLQRGSHCIFVLIVTLTVRLVNCFLRKAMQDLGCHNQRLQQYRLGTYCTAVIPQSWSDHAKKSWQLK